MQCWRSPGGRARAAAELIAHCRSALFLFFFTHRVGLHSTLGRSQGEGSQVWRIARGRSRTPRQQSRYESTCFALETRALYAQETLSEIDCGVWCQRGFLKHLCFCCFKKPLVLQYADMHLTLMVPVPSFGSLLMARRQRKDIILIRNII